MLQLLCSVTCCTIHYPALLERDPAQSWQRQTSVHLHERPYSAGLGHKRPCHELSRIWSVIVHAQVHAQAEAQAQALASQASAAQAAQSLHHSGSMQDLQVTLLCRSSPNKLHNRESASGMRL